MKNNSLANLFFNNSLIICLAYLIFIKPDCISLYSSINQIVNIISILFGLIILLLFFSQKKISKLQLSIILFIFLLFISTTLYSHDFWFFIKLYFNFMIISIYTELLIKTNLEKFLKCISFLIFNLIFINSITVLIYPNGLHNIDGYYFLGYDNSTVITVVLGIFVMIIASHYFKNRISFLTYLAIIIALLTYIDVWAVSCMIAMSLLIFFVIFIYKRNTLKTFINFKLLFIFFIILFFSIVIFRLQDTFSYLIVDVFHRDMTFTGRTYIWDRCLYYIKDNFLLGLGVENYDTRYLVKNIYHAHSTFLNILLEGGIIGLLSYLNIFRVVGTKLKDVINNEYAKIVTFSLFIYFIATLVDVIHNSQMLFVILNIGFYSSYILNHEKEK